jgi:dTDP-4-amino-4,6-dideoxygalactose transaminase
MPVPLLDLRAQHATIKKDVIQAMMQVVEDQAFILGEPVQRLERQVAELSNTRYAVGCANGTDALLLAMRALDVGRGDEVVTTPFTFFATAGTIHNAGATPVFVDIEPSTFNISPEAVRDAVRPATKAVIPVDLFGQMAAVEEVARAAPGVPLIEDAAQSIGARRQIDGRWTMAGEAATIGTFSFFPSKNLGGYGDGGMIVTQDEALANRLMRLQGVGTSIYYPLPLHLQPCFAYLGYTQGACPEAERAAREVLSLPIYPELTHAQLDEVIACVRQFYGRS